MNNEKITRNQLVELLNGGNAHMKFAEAVKDFPVSRINELFPNGTYSAWGLLEHIRITQEDILDFSVNRDYKEKEWPKGYWPDPKNSATEKDWNKTISSYAKDVDALKHLAENPQVDLYAKIPWGDGQTILREILLVVDHTAYHVGEFAIMRQTMGTWNKR